MMELCEKYKEDFTEVTLCIHKNVLSELRSQMTIRHISGGIYGLSDSFLLKLIEEIDKGHPAIEFVKKTDKEKYERTENVD